MTSKTPRRNFLKTTAKRNNSYGSWSYFYGINYGIVCIIKKYIIESPFDTGFDQQPLPYAYNALEDIIEKTMEIHYTKHAAAYSKNLKEAVAAEGVDAKKL